MKHLSKIIILIVLILSSANIWAVNDTILHDFQALVGASRLKFYKNDLKQSNKIGKVDETFVYTCENSAVFWGDSGNNNRISLKLPGKDDYTHTSQVENLIGVHIWYSPVNDDTDGIIKVQVSEDGSNWREDIVSVDSDYSYGQLKVDVPKGDYYVKIYNSRNTQLSLVQIRYYIDNCNCFPYVAP